MAKKSRTPAPPRPVQAPKRRATPRDPRRTRLWIAAGVGVLLLAALGGGLAFALGRDGGGAATGACEVQTYPAQGQEHVAKLPEGFEPNSFPRTSGPHGQTPVVYTEYDEPVPQLNLVHNLEHGAIAIQYGPDVPEDVLNQLRAWYRVDARGLVLAPLPDVPEARELADKITLAAWYAEREDPDESTSPITKQEGKLAICSTFDEKAFDDFREDYGAKGPELFTLDDMQPGNP